MDRSSMMKSDEGGLGDLGQCPQSVFPIFMCKDWKLIKIWNDDEKWAFFFFFFFFSRIWPFLSDF